jgi:CDP-diacylglycerol---glycerol-3-phosphate 3-phosphatidyltransferase
MIVRSALRCSATQRLNACKPWSLRAKHRRYSTASSPVLANGASQASILGVFTGELDKIAPRFDMNGSQIQILRSPTDFYEALKVDIASTLLHGNILTVVV